MKNETTEPEVVRRRRGDPKSGLKVRGTVDVFSPEL